MKQYFGASAVTARKVLLLLNLSDVDVESQDWEWIAADPRLLTQEIFGSVAREMDEEVRLAAISVLLHSAVILYKQAGITGAIAGFAEFLYSSEKGRFREYWTCFCSDDQHELGEVLFGA